MITLRLPPLPRGSRPRQSVGAPFGAPQAVVQAGRPVPRRAIPRIWPGHRQRGVLLAADESRQLASLAQGRPKAGARCTTGMAGMAAGGAKEGHGAGRAVRGRAGCGSCADSGPCSPDHGCGGGGPSTRPCRPLASQRGAGMAAAMRRCRHARLKPGSAALASPAARQGGPSGARPEPGLPHRIKPLDRTLRARRPGPPGGGVKGPWRVRPPAGGEGEGAR